MRACVVVLLLAVTSPARAGGFLVNDQGAEAFSRAGAFVAKASDPSALVHNPAGLAGAGTFELFLGANLVGASVSFERAGVYPDQGLGENSPAYVGQPFPEVQNDSGPQVVPLVAASLSLGSLGLGLGLYAPQGYARRDYPAEVMVAGEQAPAPQRYDIVRQEPLVALPSVAVAYRFGPVDVGARASWGIGQVDARVAVWGLENEPELPGRDVLFEVETRDWFAPTYGLGALWHAAPWLEVGVAYAAEVALRNEGDATFELGDELRFPFGMDEVELELVPVDDDSARCAPGGRPGRLKACIGFTVPAHAQLGARVILRDGAGHERGDVELDVRWEDWSDASDVEVIVDGKDSLIGREIEPSVIRHGFRDTWAARLGGSWAIATGAGDLGLRAGIAWDSAAADPQWQRADLDGASRLTLAGGLALSRGHWTIEAGGALLLQGDRVVGDGTVDPVFPLGDGQTDYPVNNGVHSARFWAGSVALVTRW